MAEDKTKLSRRDVARLGTGIAALAVPAAAAAAAQPSRGGARISAGDRLEIIELMARYAWAYDTNETQDMLDTFTDDGVLYVFGNKVGGKAEIPAFLAEGVNMRGEAYQHLTDHHVFRDFTGNACTVYSFYTMIDADKNGSNGRVRAVGYYVSYCRKERGEWRFARRDVVRWNGKQPW